MKTNEFVPRRIGEENILRTNETQRAYEKLIDAANELKPAIEVSLKRKITLDEFLEFLRNEPEKWLYSQYVKDNDISFPGLSTAKIIEMKMLDISGISDVMDKLANFKSSLIPVKISGLFFPLRKLYDSDLDKFTETGDFWEARDQKWSKFTATPEQGKILDLFEKLCDVLNELDGLNIVRSKNGASEISMLDEYIEISKTRTTPFVVNSHLFYQHRLAKYREKGFVSNNGSMTDIFI